MLLLHRAVPLMWALWILRMGSEINVRCDTVLSVAAYQSINITIKPNKRHVDPSLKIDSVVYSKEIHINTQPQISVPSSFLPVADDPCTRFHTLISPLLSLLSKKHTNTLTQPPTLNSSLFLNTHLQRIQNDNNFLSILRKNRRREREREKECRCSCVRSTEERGRGGCGLLFRSKKQHDILCVYF